MEARRTRGAWAALAAALLWTAAANGASEQNPDPQGPEQETAATEREPRRSEPAPEGTAGPGQGTEPVVVYVPPVRRGAPERRVGGGTRGAARCPVRLAALAPEEHAGLTQRSQPTLYWNTSGPIECRVDFTLSAVATEGDPELLVEATLAGPFEPGIHAIRLADHSVELAPGGRYQWFVAVVQDPERRSKDVVAGAFIARVAPAAQTPSHVGAAAGPPAAAELAREGLWYDALGVLSEDAAAGPGQGAARAVRAALLEQVGLAEVAATERAAAAAR